MQGFRFKFSREVVFIFFIALVIRGLLFFSITDHPEVIFQPDSRMYVLLAEGLTKYGSFVYPETPAQPDVERMLGYPHKIVITIL